MKATITTLLVLAMIIAAQGFAWFIATAFGYKFGTENYGFVSLTIAVFSFSAIPVIVAIRERK